MKCTVVLFCESEIYPTEVQAETKKQSAMPPPPDGMIGS